jgi:hypothetical protein
MQTNLQRKRNVVFLSLISIVVLTLGLVKGAPYVGLGGLANISGAVLAVAAVVLGLVLVALTLRLPESRIQRTFFLLAGAAPAAMVVCVLLHNLIYGILLRWFGEGFWERHGTDEPVFFILAVFVCPALFLIGTVGGISSLIRARMAKL